MESGPVRSGAVRSGAARSAPPSRGPGARGKAGSRRPHGFRLIPRRQLPVHSPLTLDALGRAARGALSLRRAALPRLEACLRNDFGAASAILCDRGTSALQLALRLADRMTPGANIVALPAFTCFEVAAAAVGAEALVTLYDIDPGTLSPEPDSVERALGEGARVLVVSPLFGISPDWTALRERARAHGAVLIEDAAQGHGGSGAGGLLGSHGCLSVLSFGRGKGWSGCGGGALLIRADEDVRVPLPADDSCDFLGIEDRRVGDELKVVAAAIGQWALGRAGTYALPASVPWLGLGESRYHPPRPPARMTRASAELLLSTREGALEEVRVRRRNAAYYARHLPAGPHVRPVTSPCSFAEGATVEDGFSATDASCGFLRFPLRLARGIEGFTHPESARRLGIRPVYPVPLSALDAVRARLWRRGGRWPGAEELARNLVTLPTHSLTTEEDRRAIIRLLEAYG